MDRCVEKKSPANAVDQIIRQSITPRSVCAEMSGYPDTAAWLRPLRPVNRYHDSA
jgi:hypothetical protein